MLYEVITLVVGESVLGTLGEVHPRVLENYDIELPVCLFDLDIEAFFAAAAAKGAFRAPSRFPDVYRDSALLLDESVSAQQRNNFV